MTNLTAAPEAPGTRDRESAPRLADFTADLLWPRLFQSVTLALKPERIGLAFFGLVAAMAIGSIAEAWGKANSTFFVLDSVGRSFSGIAAGVFALSAGDIAAGVRALTSLPARVWAEYRWLSLLHLPAAMILAVAGCAICRMAACDFSQGVVLGWTHGLRFAVRKAGSLLTALLAPLVLVAVIAAGLALAGATLGWPAVNVVGAILYGLFLLAGAVAVLVLACWALGLPLVIPAIACEGTDGLDALQRAYAYVLGRPLRLLGFAALALVIGWAAALVASLFADAATGFARWAATALSGEHGAAIITGVRTDATPLQGPDSIAANIVHFWLTIPAILVWSLALSLYFCASTIVYLLIRQVCDGQDWGELWMPGMIEGTMARAMAARAAAGGADAAESSARIGVVEESGRRGRITGGDIDE